MVILRIRGVRSDCCRAIYAGYPVVQSRAGTLQNFLIIASRYITMPENLTCCLDRRQHFQETVACFALLNIACMFSGEKNSVTGTVWASIPKKRLRCSD